MLYSMITAYLSELRMMDLVYILLSLLLFYFSFDLEYKTKKTKCDTVTGHMTWSHIM